MLVNGSRSYLPEARRRYPDLKVILIGVSPEVLKRRLEARGRETPEQIQARLERNNQINDALVIIPHAVINNDGALDKAGEMLIQHLLRHRKWAPGYYESPCLIRTWRSPTKALSFEGFNRMM